MTKNTFTRPLRLTVVVCQSKDQRPNNLFIKRSRRQVYGLVNVVRGRMIPFGEPILEDLLFGRSGLESDLRGNRRNSPANKTILITPHKQVSYGLRIGLHADTQRLC